MNDKKFFIQEQPLGMGNAILEAESWLDTEFFLVCAGDSIFYSDSIKKMIDLHLNKKPDVTIATEIATHEEMTTRSCVVHDNNGFVKQIIEKPKLDEEGSLDIHKTNVERVTIGDLKDLHRKKIQVSKQEKIAEQRKIEERQRLIEARKEEFVSRLDARRTPAWKIGEVLACRGPFIRVG